MFFDFGVTRDGLTNFRLRIRMLFVFPAVPNEDRASFHDFLDEFAAFQLGNLIADTSCGFW